jgi:hypothetical protein
MIPRLPMRGVYFVGIAILYACRPFWSEAHSSHAKSELSIMNKITAAPPQRG